MGQIHPFKPEKLVLPILISKPDLRRALLEKLGGYYGTIDYTSDDLPFDYTDYYNEEMGTPISRFFLSFRTLVDPSDLARIKIETNGIEEQFKDRGRRRINLDPGILNLSRFILASSKDGPQRIPLSRGIFAEVTLIFEKGSYGALKWTYPDYRSPQYAAILGEIRRLYKAQLRRKEV